MGASTKVILIMMKNTGTALSLSVMEGYMKETGKVEDNMVKV